MATYRHPGLERKRHGQHWSCSPRRAGAGGASPQGPEGTGRRAQGFRPRQGRRSGWSRKRRFAGPGSAESAQRKGQGTGCSGPGPGLTLRIVDALVYKGWTKEELISALLSEVRATGVPYSSQARRAVLQGLPDADRPRSCLFGLYTKMGLGIATQTSKAKWQRTLALIHALAACRPPNANHAYAAIMLNHNTKVSLHADAANTGLSTLLSFGRHSGGALWLEDAEGEQTLEIEGQTAIGVELNTYETWQSFDGHHRHCVLQAYPLAGDEQAERYSITLFCPGRLHAVPSDVWTTLSQMGFPVDGLCERHGAEGHEDGASTGKTRPVARAPESSKRKRGRRGLRTPYEASAVVGALALAGAPSLARCSTTTCPSLHRAPLAELPQVKRGLSGSTACMLSLDTCWTQVVKGRVPSRFLEFLRAGQNSPSAKDGEELPSPSEERHSGRNDPLPCALPYSWTACSAPRSSRRRARWHKIRHRRQWINAALAYLDWLYMGKPSGRGLSWASTLRGPLSSEQWHLVSEMEAAYLAVCRLGESAEEPSGGLSRLAAELHHTLSLSYGMGLAKGQNVVPKELNESNMSLPEVAGIVPLKYPVVPKMFEDIFETPNVFLRDPADMPIRLPSWYMNVRCWPGIARQLILHGLCRAVHVAEVVSWHGMHLRAGLFGVEKPQSSLRRVIVDRRRRNAIERCVRQIVLEKALAEKWPPENLEYAWRLLTLPHGSQLGEMMCSPQACIRGWSEDARDYFYLLRYADIRHAETIIGYDVSSAEYSPDELAEMGIEQDWEKFALALVSPAMGDQKSMEVAQLCHQHIMLENGGMTQESWLTYRWPFPSSSIVSGCYCDDFGQLAIGADDVDDADFSVTSVMQEARQRIGKVHKGYRESGLIRKETKAQAEVTTLSLWGATVDGEKKTVRGSLEKVKALALLTAETLAGRTVSSDELSALLGHWTHHSLFRRQCLCLLDEAYAWIRRDSLGSKRRRLGAKVRDELLGLLLLWPLLRADMQTVPGPRVYASDATVSRGAVVESSPLSEEMATFFWSRRKQKHEEMVRSAEGSHDLFEFPAADRPCQDSLLEHVLLATPLHVVADYRFRRQSHINVQELLAYRTSLRAAARRRECWRTKTPFLIDSQVVVNVIARGRSSSHQLNYVLQTCLPLSLLCGIVPLPMWIGTSENPSDDPTRGRALRQCGHLCREAQEAVRCTASRFKWVFLVTKAQWKARRDQWDSSLGFPGEGPQQRTMPPQNQGQDLRVRVSTLTMRRYADRLAAFQRWLSDHKLGEVQELVRDPIKINAVVVPYLQGMYNEAKPVSHGSFLLAGLQLYYPHTIGHLQPSWQIQRQWNQLSPSEARTPLPLEVLLALAVGAWVQGLQRTAVALMLGFHLLLRPAEIGSAKRKHLTLPSDTGGALDSGVFAIMKPKTARTTLLQSVVIEDPKLLLLAEGVFGLDPPESLWIRGGLAKLQANFSSLKRSLDIHDTPYTLGSLRAGGSVEYLQRTSNSAGLQIRGRWASQKS
eukprot:5505535-Amphidinium_carterae.1